MMKQRTFALATAAVGASVLLAACASPMMAKPGSDTGTTFFVSSRGSGQGGNLGGLAGADQLCTTLARNAGAGSHTWRAYLSTVTAGGFQGVAARDRIGKGPWRNAKGVVVAQDLAQLHGSNNITKQTALTESGAVVNGRGDTPNQHDILTGSQPDGTAIGGNLDSTCHNWTTSGDDGKAMVGHSDRTGLDESAPAKSWNSSHLSRGCSVAALKMTGSDARLYCFAAN